MQIFRHKNVRKMGKNAIFGGGGSQGHLRAQDRRMKKQNLGITEHRNPEGERAIRLPCKGRKRNASLTTRALNKEDSTQGL